ncbi:MAG TPA: peptidoglycan-binding protein [Candidatus Limiplasma sp.]|nr:peptidoglycan-binding protein [Candidatus Limiplasma sp.]HPR77596.1 peptidoglycan-binding protein [Candidatus Limiplasma sp.]
MRKKPTVFTLVLWVALAGCCVGVLLLLPKTIDAYNAYTIERDATPTPTAVIASVLQVTVDPANTPSPTPMVLSAGSSGDAVSKLQTRLQALGFYSGALDGQYGQGTAAAVKLFQSQHGLTADGLAGTETLNALYSDAAETYIPTPTPSPTPSMLSKGDKGDAVRALQQRLKDLGYYSGNVDGDFGGGTQEAVRLFQSQNGLDVDGVSGGATLAAVFASDAPTVSVTPTPDPASLPILVNKDHPITADYQPQDLVNLRNVLPSSLVYVKGSDIQGNRDAATALQTMFEAAKADGITGWQISAGYRSYAYQQQLFQKQVDDYMAQGKSKADAVAATKLTVADPGTSEHHTGLAFDITVANTIFKGTKQQIWLSKHCWDYGFIIRYQEGKEKITGFVAECWHIRYVGVQHSTVMRDHDWCLEEYIQEMTK